MEPLPNNPLSHSATDPLFTVGQAAAATGLKPQTWRGIFNRRDVPLVRVRGRLYVRQSTMLAYLEACAEGPAE
ncbi:MAG: helix-turn-helix domain-containing protein [Propionicimonas sp.]|uniref:helix-turn-helix domain-containing protein n=1 Tax=Propionicimonas sp. TaxID=1955623 RepID=UPI002B1F1D19|nr:helix-turn-helix domain-containing protein [Propionicimonas sp.]MEA4944533.1 helix-turn-helix domain-containing protein [Propionicimonas sp.]MEA5119639.1 helix-turn-helix domain-containing protein [Propionicimonas sp.]